MPTPSCPIVGWSRKELGAPSSQKFLPSPCSALGSLGDPDGEVSSDMDPVRLEVLTETSGGANLVEVPQVAVPHRKVFRYGEPWFTRIPTLQLHIHAKDCRILQGFSRRILFLDAFGALL